MPHNKLKLLSAAFLSVALIQNFASAQVSYNSEGKRNSIYFSIGTSTPKYSPSTINITQGSAGSGSSYNLEQVSADNQVSASGGGISKNLRLGFFFDHEQHMAIELSYDPLAYHVVDGQNVHLTGTLENVTKDTTVAFSAKDGYCYYLDGANMLMANFVYRYQLWRSPQNSLRIDALGKVGFGPVMPHVYNSMKGKTAEYPSFQLAGWDMGVEAALRLTIMRHIFVDLAPKYTYASYTDVGVYDGTATQKLKTFQMVVSLGVWVPLTPHNPLFQKIRREKAALTIKPIHPEPIDDRSN